MPELPEVETVVRGLRRVLPGRCILGIQLGKTDFIDDPAALERDLPGCRIAAVRRHGKFIAMDLSIGASGSPDSCLVVHLGMTGQLVTRRPEEPVPPHTHVRMALDDGRELRYTDPRRFGRMLLAGNGTASGVLGVLGQDPLEIPRVEFTRLLAERKARIKALLLDQRFLRGMGNIYTDESLWRARIHPARLACALKPGQVRSLYAAMRNILKHAIRLGGSTISDYVDAQGQPGEFQIRHRAYGREGKPCIRCRRKIRRMVVAGRSSYYCPRCQPNPRTG